MAPKFPLGKSGRVTELDGLRGVLAWTVVATHLLLVSGAYDPLIRRFPPFGEIAETAVDVFMLLSGFAITNALALRPAVVSYFVRRACRILPAYYVALTAGIFLNQMLADNLRHLPAESLSPFYLQICQLGQERLWLDGPLHFLLLQGVFPAAVLPAEPYTLLGVAWSLSLEFQFYLLAPLIFFCGRRWRGALFILAAAVALTTLFAGRIIGGFSSAFLPAKAAFFLVGGISFFVLQRHPSARSARAACLVPSIALGSLWWLGTGRVTEAIFGPLIWCAVLYAVRFDRFQPLRSWLNSRLMQLLGRISYSTYIFHGAVVILLQGALWRWVRPATGTAVFLWTTLAGVPLIFAVSWLTWRAIERPFQRLSRPAREKIKVF